MTELECQFFTQCSGCSLMDQPLVTQQLNKVKLFHSQAESAWELPLPEIEIHCLGPGYLRDRLDFTFEDGRLGLYHKDKKEIVDLPSCAQLSPELSNFLTEFRKVLLPIRRGSVRLRVSPENQRGLWLDFSHDDVKNLMSERHHLLALMELGLVEIGQRRKHLINDGDRLRLRDPEFQTWTSTWAGGEEIKLFSAVGSFTQTGQVALKKISQLIERFTQNAKAQTAVEFGSGIGSLSFPAAAHVSKLTACESDSLAAQALKKTLSAHPEFQEKIEISVGDFQRKKTPPHKADLVLLNPPRSGIGNFAEDLSTETSTIIYMSCFSESLIRDCQNFSKMGFHLENVSLIDQFPQTPHGEWITVWQR